MPKRFRTAYIAQESGHDFSELEIFCDQLLFVTAGDESFSELATVVYAALASFDPQRDIVVPVGKVGVNLMIGQALGDLLLGQPYRVALFRPKEGTYVIEEVDPVSTVLKEAA